MVLIPSLESQFKFPTSKPGSEVSWWRAMNEEFRSTPTIISEIKVSLVFYAFHCEIYCQSNMMSGGARFFTSN